MTRITQVTLVTLGLTGFSQSPLSADTIQTAAGETISGRETTVVDGEFVVPAADKKPEQRLKLADLEKITFSPGKPIGELKTLFLRIDQPGNGKPLMLPEVQVYEGDKEIGQKGKARQSVTYMDDDEKWGAQKAIDGKTGGDSTTDGCTRTLPTNNPWWELELPAESVLKKIVIWMRTDAQPNTKMTGLRVQLLNAKRQVLWTKSFTNLPTPKLEISPPVHSDKISAEDAKALEGLGTSTTASPLAAMVDAWIKDEKVTIPAETPATSSSPSPAVVRRALGGFSAEAPNQNTAATPNSPAAAFPDNDWLVRFEPGGFVVGKLKSWDDKGLTVEFTLERQQSSITIPTASIIEVSSKDIVTKKLPLDRTQLAAEGDTVFAKAEGNAVQAVSGNIKGIDGESLQFEYQGKVRGIKLARVASIMRKTPPSASEGTVGIVSLSNAMRLAGVFKSLSETAGVLELPWKQTVDLSRTAVKAISVKSGRAVALTDVDPAKVDYTPFLDRVLPYRKNESLTGAPLSVGDKKFDRGLCAHSGTALTYELNGGFEKLRLQIGLQKDDGVRGQAVVRFKADDVVLTEKPLTGKSPAEAVEVPLTGKKSLTIEVDYGDGLDVGDHVVLGNPVLVRTP